MPPDDPSFAAVRGQLVAQGLRIIGFEFSGSDGVQILEGLRVPAAEVSASAPVHLGRIRWRSNLGAAQWERLRPHRDALRAVLFYRLEQWRSDWATEYGSRGLLTLDLLTGEALIELEREHRQVELICETLLDGMAPLRFAEMMAATLAEGTRHVA